MDLNPPDLAVDADCAPEAGPAANTAKVRVCAECGKEFSFPTKGPGQHKRFCDSTCRTAFANREKAQGAVIVTMAKVWRRARGSGATGKAAFAEMTRSLDLLIDRDRSTNVVDGKSLADRLPDYANLLLGEGTYFDRMDENRLGKGRG